jgi:hypothetical protein
MIGRAYDAYWAALRDRTVDLGLARPAQAGAARPLVSAVGRNAGGVDRT